MRKWTGLTAVAIIAGMPEFGRSDGAGLERVRRQSRGCRLIAERQQQREAVELWTVLLPKSGISRTCNGHSCGGDRRDADLDACEGGIRPRERGARRRRVTADPVTQCQGPSCPCAGQPPQGAQAHLLGAGNLEGQASVLDPSFTSGGLHAGG